MKQVFSKKVVLSVFAIVFVVILLAFFTRKHVDPSSLGKVTKEDLIQRVSFSGVVQPARKALVVPPYSGYVKKLYVKMGDMVKSGEPIVAVAQSLSNQEEVYPLRSPVNGKVVQIRRVEGEYVKAADTTDFVVRIDDLSEMLVQVNAAEIDRVKMVLKQEAILKPMALSQKTYKAQIVSLSLAASEKDRWDRSSVVEFPVTLKILNPDDDLKSGMGVMIDIVTFKKEQTLTLRHEFVYLKDDLYYVIMANGEKRDIKVGIANEEAVEILEGLKEGDEVQKVDFAALLENDK